jgi:hypothetical protein
MFKLIKIYQELSVEIKLLIIVNTIFFLVSYLELAFQTIIMFELLIIFYLIRSHKYIFKIEKYYKFYVIYLILLLIIGLINQNNTSYMIWDLICFSEVLLVFGTIRFNKEYFFKYELPNFAYILNILSILFVAAYVYSNGFTIASIESGRGLDDITKDITSPKFFLTACLFLYPLKLYVKEQKRKAVFDVSIIAYILFSVAMGSRGTTTAAIVVFVLTGLSAISSNNTYGKLKIRKYIFFTLGTIIISAALYQIKEIGSAVDYLAYRFDNESLGSARTEEATAIYDALSRGELLFGKGLGAANTYWIFSDVQNGVNSVHYGWMFLILKGGILFLIAIYGFIILKIINYYKYKEYRPYGIILIGFLLLEFSHTNFNSFYSLSFMFLALFAQNFRQKDNI